jgi:uncharacterized cupin superfamily protein
MNLEKGREILGRLVFESRFSRESLQLVRPNQSVDVPTLTELLDRPRRGRSGGSPPEVVADHEQSTGPNELTALFEQAPGRWYMHERLDGKCHIGRREAGG